jgi:hypothetical protein
MIKGILISYVCKLAKEVSRIKNIELMPKFGKGLFIKWLGKDIGQLIFSVNVSNLDIPLLLVIPKKMIPNGYVFSAAMFDGIVDHFDCTLVITLSGTIIRGTLKTPNSQLVTPISIKLLRPDGCD